MSEVRPRLHIGPAVKERALAQFGRRDATQRPTGETAAPARPVTTVKSVALHDLQFRATVEGHEFISDEREGGQDAGPAPLRYFLGGIMMCHQVMCVKSAAMLDLPLDHLESEISGYLGRPATGEPGGFVRLELTVRIDSANSDDQMRTIVEQAGERCPAFVTAARASRIDLTLQHNGTTILERTYGE